MFIPRIAGRFAIRGLKQSGRKERKMVLISFFLQRLSKMVRQVTFRVDELDSAAHQRQHLTIFKLLIHPN